MTTETFGLVADLLYALGFALWTGVVVVLFVQVLPEVKRRQIERWLDDYEATLRDRAHAGSDQASGDTNRRERVSGQVKQPPVQIESSRRHGQLRVQAGVWSSAERA